jgi:hypothetical protein
MTMTEEVLVRSVGDVAEDDGPAALYHIPLSIFSLLCDDF